MRLSALIGILKKCAYINGDVLNTCGFLNIRCRIPEIYYSGVYVAYSSNIRKNIRYRITNFLHCVIGSDRVLVPTYYRYTCTLILPHGDLFYLFDDSVVKIKLKNVAAS